MKENGESDGNGFAINETSWKSHSVLLGAAVIKELRRIEDSNPDHIGCECNSLSSIELYGLGMLRFWMVIGQRPSHSFRID
jgi:hypothetical protein